MGLRGMLAAGLAVAVSVGSGAAALGAGSPNGNRGAVQHTQAGMALARAVLLRSTDIGRAWTQGSPAPTKVSSLTCPQFNPHVSGVTETGAASSPTFHASASGPFVSDTAHVYATASEETTEWRAVAQPGLLVCAVDSLRRNGSQGVSFAVTGRHLLPLPAFPAASAGYRVTGTASVSYQTIDVYFDMIVVGRGQTITTVAVSSFEQPPAHRLELRLARAVARRMSWSTM